MNLRIMTSLYLINLSKYHMNDHESKVFLIYLKFQNPSKNFLLDQDHIIPVLK